MEFTEEELHYIGMNFIGEELQKMGFEFLAVNSKLKKHPQFVTYKKGEKNVFIMVQSFLPPNDYTKVPEVAQKVLDKANEQNANLWFAGVVRRQVLPRLNGALRSSGRAGTRRRGCAPYRRPQDPRPPPDRARCRSAYRLQSTARRLPDRKAGILR